MTWEGPEESYNIRRWYKSSWGRYTTTDPLGLITANLFAYALGNPLSFYDPTGEYIVDVNVPTEKHYISIYDVKNLGGCPSTSESCTTYDPSGIWLDCPCKCLGAEGWAMEAIGHVTKSTMHLAPPYAKYRQHELLHLQDLKNELESYLIALESQRFAEQGQCDDACTKERGGFTQWVRDWAKKSNDTLD